MKNITEKAKSIENSIIEWRRSLHEIPELGFEEFKTSEFIKNTLTNMGLDFYTQVAKTGVCLSLTKGSGPVVLLRADMDGLPIEEQTELSFASKHPGRMHACGHDAHVAMLLGATQILKDEFFQGTVKIFFQPSEEGTYGDKDGLSGAGRAIKDGILKDVDSAIAVHQVPNIPCGYIAVDEGPVMAAADLFEIEVIGKAAHAGASPESGIDAIIIASELVNSLQNIVSRQTRAQDTLVISISTFNSGHAPNIVADRAILTGTIRALNEQVHDNAIRLIDQKCNSLASMYDTEIKFKLTHCLPVTRNSKKVTDIVSSSAEKIFGSDNVLRNVVTMGGEDFGIMSQSVPSCFALLGTKPSTEPVYSLHNNKMTINESALYLGTAYLAQSALDLLSSLEVK